MADLKIHEVTTYVSSITERIIRRKCNMHIESGLKPEWVGSIEPNQLSYSHSAIELMSIQTLIDGDCYFFREELR